MRKKYPYLMSCNFYQLSVGDIIDKIALIVLYMIVFKKSEFYYVNKI